MSIVRARGVLRVLWAAVLLLGCATAQAEPNDGGTRSPFAHGTGNRALAMGGAFVAVSDDATAAIWNPGGLGMLQRRELQFSYTSNPDLETSSSYFGVAWPSWRLGTAALSVRQFGIGGVERRDDRNTLLASDFADAETEISLGFGRAMTGASSLGGTFKLQRQSLAGTSGSGVGADLGVLLRPGGWLEPWFPGAERLSFGLAARNLWQPSVRLDRESVPDPTTIQSGLAYRHPFAGDRELLASFDLEHSPNLSARLHAGVELRFGRLLALRAGANQRRLTAGTGFTWRSLAIDYAFEDLELGAAQRIGVTHVFGPSVSESRSAATAAAEQAFQSRMDETYERRQAEQVSEFLSRADALRAGQRYDEALELLTALTTLAPHAPAAEALEARCWVEKARRLEQQGDYTGANLAYGRASVLAPADTAAAGGLARCRNESDRRAARSAELKRRFANAFDAFVANDFARAKQGFARIVAEEPKDSAAAEMLRRATGAQALQARADSARTAQPARGLRSAESSGDGGTARPSGRRLSREEQKEVGELYRRGIAAMEMRHAEEAIRYWELVWSKDPRHERVAEYLKREYLLRGMENFAAGRFEVAAELWEKAVKLDPTDPRASAYLARAREQQERVRTLLERAR